MRLEEEIKQEKFKSEYQKLMINQLFTGKWITNIISKSLKPFGLTNQQYNVLRILRGQKDNAISVNAISDRMIDKMSNVSRLVDKLNNKGLVKRKVNKSDRRQVDIQITSEGKKLVEEVEKTEPQMMENFSRLSAAEVEKLNDLLDKFRG